MKRKRRRAGAHRPTRVQAAKPRPGRRRPRPKRKSPKRQIAAYKGQITKLKKALAAAQAAAPPEVTLTAGEVLLYEAPEAEGANAFAEWRDLPVLDTRFAVHVQLLIEGEVVEEETLRVPPAWDTEPPPASIRREVRSWLAQVKQEHPEWKDSPRATLVRLALASDTERSDAEEAA